MNIKSNEILVTGGSGLLGKTLKSILPNAIYISSSDYDLRYYNDVNDCFKKYKPKTIIHLAAKAGGIIDNVNKPCDYLEDNLLINTNVLSCARKLDIKNVLSMSSTCVYPMESDIYPMNEDMIMEGKPEPTNDGYAYSKRVMIKQSQKSNVQYGTNFKFITPCNLYGETDNFKNIDKAHFVTALMLKIHESQKTGNPMVLYGDGTPIRQFIHVKDLSIIIKKLVLDIGIEKIPQKGINICTDETLSIDEMVKLGYETLNIKNYNYEYDPNKPNGVKRKDVCNDKLKELIPSIDFIKLKEGMRMVFNKIKEYDKVS